MHRHPANLAVHDDASFAERIGVRISQAMATGVLLAAQALLILAWIFAARVLHLPIDNAGLTILNLGLSLQAAFAAPLILLASRRQEEHARLVAEHAYANGQRALALLEQLTEEKFGA